MMPSFPESKYYPVKEGEVITLNILKMNESQLLPAPWEWARAQAQEDRDTEQEAEIVHWMFLALSSLRGLQS